MIEKRAPDSDELPSRLAFASDDFTLEGRKAGRLPFIRLQDGTLHEIAAEYFWLCVKRGCASGTMEVIAYALKDWFQFLDQRNVSWDMASDNLLFDWMNQQSKRLDKRGVRKISAARIRSKLDVVFRFYWDLQMNGIVADLVQDPRQDCAYGSYRISAKLVVRRSKHSSTQSCSVTTCLSFKDPLERRHPKRLTPETEQVEKVLDCFLARPGRDGISKYRNYFCARVMAQMGLRREGVANLSIFDLQQALADKGILISELKDETGECRQELIRKGWRPWFQGLDMIADMPDERNRIIAEIIELQKISHRYLYIDVVEKGRKARTVPIPLPLMRAILVEWVWGHRANFIAKRRMKYPQYAPPPKLWLGETRGTATSARTIGNEIKKSFNEAGVNASGHRLRAYFLTELVRALYARAREIHGIMFDAAAILMEAAEIAGHENIASLEPYLTRVRKEEAFLQGESVHVRFSSDAEMLRGIADTLSYGGSDLCEHVRTFLTLMMDRFGIARVFLREQLPDPAEQIRQHRERSMGIRKHNVPITPQK